MSDWRLAKSLITLQKEVNAAWPHRPKQSDGTIGDARHQTEQSDHNPLPPHAGVVTAWDITTAPFSIDLAETFRRMGKNGDLRVKYVIYRAHITSAQHAWQWAPYTGFSKHYDHIHISVADSEAEYDRTDPWHVFDVKPHIDIKPTPVQEDDMVIAQGSTPTKYVTNGLTKRGIHNEAEYHDLQQLGYKEIKLADATLAAIPDQK